jgi:small subunit ribosomal protein S2
MRRLPNLMFIIDVRRDALAIKEANTLGIPVIALVDTNCDPEPVDYVIPSNDDAIRAIKLIISTIASACVEGRAMLNTIRAEEDEAAGIEGEEDMERYLGPSTLAKIRADLNLDEVSEEFGAEEDDEDIEAEVVEAEDAPITSPLALAAALAIETNEEETE